MTDQRRAAAGRKGGRKGGKAKGRRKAWGTSADYARIAKLRRRHCPTCTCEPKSVELEVRDVPEIPEAGGER